MTAYAMYSRNWTPVIVARMLHCRVAIPVFNPKSRTHFGWLLTLNSARDYRTITPLSMKTPSMPIHSSRTLSIVVGLLLAALGGSNNVRGDAYDDMRAKWLALLNGGTNYNTTNS